ncbi:copper amine oxidase [Jeotgalibacillus proteolyticus]|uniref:Copper amine oxidase n=1 Tax=Jeotgalibacillus proteolyticus TaxID=2082395 RepID=A0A2S5GCX1_9BACL|nr:copper amine oxidase [Jeotgalibacillus proteolyticus]PPA70882.1 copper amine oxidase [Jeotgalibacillus proteolyticus]
MKMKKIAASVLGLSLLVPAVGQAQEAPTVNDPAADLRADLDYLLSEHFVLATTTMVKEYLDAPDADAYTQSLDQNVADMTPAIASIYGDEGAAEFERIFRGHNDYTADIVAAAQSGDENARAAAEEEVEEFVVEFSTFLDAATEGNLPQEAAEEAIRAHEMDVLSFFDSFVEEDYEGAYTTFREGYDRMYDISAALSGAITAQFPDQFGDYKVDSATSELRSTLNNLAAEHHALAVMGLKSGVDGAPNYDFITWAEDMHTQDFKEVIGSVYGEEGAAAFEDVWTTNHIEAEGELVSAYIAEDDEAISAAKEQFETFSNDFGAFLGTATEEKLPTADAQAAVWGHEELKQKALETHVAGDYTASMDTFREGYKYMFGVGEALGNAIVAQHPDKFASTEMPEEMPNTGMGGSQQNSSSVVWVGIGAAASALAAAFFLRRREQKA